MLLGGILTSGLSWRWVLFVNVPIGIAAAILSPRTLVESRAENAAHTIDAPGAVTVTAGLALLVYAVVDAVNSGWGSTTLLRLAGAAVLLVTFLAIERRQRQPLMPFSIFRLRTLRGANIVGLLIGMSLLSMFFFISLYLQNVLHYSSIKAGISYLPLAVGIILAAGAASQLVARLGFKTPLIAGLINTSQQVGGALGLAILATIANGHTQSLFHTGVHSTAVALTKGFDRAFLIGAGFAVVGAILAAGLISSRDSREHAKEAGDQNAATAPGGDRPPPLRFEFPEQRRPPLGRRWVPRARRHSVP